LTSAEKIIAAHSDKKIVYPGDNIIVKHDLAVGDELSILGMLEHLNGAKEKIVTLNNHIALINGHITTPREAPAGSRVDVLEQFANEHKIINYLQVGKSGECGCLLAENGLISPGNVIIGTDQRIASYGAIGALSTEVSDVELTDAWINGSFRLTVPETAKIELRGRFQPLVTPKDLALHLLLKLGSEGATGLALEISGEAIDELDMNARFSLANFLIDTGASYVHLPFDQKIFNFLKIKPAAQNKFDYSSDPSAEYKWSIEVELSDIVPMVAIPGSPVNGVPARDVADVKVNQVIVGSCTNGSIEDFRMVRKILDNHKISRDIRFHLYPASHKTIREMLSDDLGLMLTARGSKISPPSCQACMGKGPNLLGPREVGLYTTNQNKKGQHGSPSSRVYLAGPLVAAATAITGYITDPRDL